MPTAATAAGGAGGGHQWQHRGEPGNRVYTFLGQAYVPSLPVRVCVCVCMYACICFVRICVPVYVSVSVSVSVSVCDGEQRYSRKQTFSVPGHDNMFADIRTLPLTSWLRYTPRTMVFSPPPGYVWDGTQRVRVSPPRRSGREHLAASRCCWCMTTCWPRRPVVPL